MSTQEQHTLPELTENHRWLDKLVGEWSYEMSFDMPDGSHATSSGTETVRSMGGYFVIGEAEGPMPGMDKATSVMTVGFNRKSNHYTGTWICSMMDHMWISEGDRVGDKLSLYSEGPDCQDPSKTMKSLDVIEFINENERTLTGHAFRDGKWQPMMRCHYKRVH